MAVRIVRLEDERRETVSVRVGTDGFDGECEGPS